MTEVKSRKITPWRVVIALIVVWGLYSVFIRFTQGLGAVTNLSDRVPWGLWVGLDILTGVALAAGGFVIGAGVEVFGLEKYKPILRPTILTAFLGYALFAIGLMFELGRPWNIWHALFYWNHHSPLFEIAWCVMLYLTVLVLEVAGIVFDRFKWKKLQWIYHKILIWLVFLAVTFSTLHQSSLGTLFTLVPEKLDPLWYSGMLPVEFFISCIAAGLGMTIFESYLSSRFLGHGLRIDLLSGIARFMVLVLGIYFIIRFEGLVTRGAMSGAFTARPEAVYFWIENFLFVFIPIGVLVSPARRKNKNWLFVGGFSVVLGLVMHRMNIAMTGLAHFERVSYFPSFTEVGISVFLVTLGVLFFGYMARNFPVFESPPEPDAKEVESVRSDRILDVVETPSQQA